MTVVHPLGREWGDEPAAGKPTSFAELRDRPASWRPRGTVIVAPRDLARLVVDGRLVAVDGEPVADGAADPDWVGDWTDARRRMTQHLRPDGRYSETRDGRRDAWTGRFWTGGPFIAYLDDTGFWAFGRRDGDVLRHAEFVLTR